MDALVAQGIAEKLLVVNWPPVLSKKNNVMANLDRQTGIVGRQIVFEYVHYREGDYNGTLGSKTGFVIETYLGADASAYSDQIFSITFLLVRMADGSIEHVPAYRLKDIVY